MEHTINDVLGSFFGPILIIVIVIQFFILVRLVRTIKNDLDYIRTRLEVKDLQDDLKQNSQAKEDTDYFKKFQPKS